MQKYKISSVIFLIFLFLTIRLVKLDNDPPHLSWSEGVFTDTGYYIHNARNKVLFDSWTFGDWDNRVLFPVYNNFMFYVFQFLGVSFKTLTSVTIFISLITSLLLYFFTYKSSGRIAGLICLSMFVFNFVWLAYNRIAVMENYSLVLLSVCLLMLLSKKKTVYFEMGVFFALSVLCKTNSAVFIGVIIVSFLYDKFIRKDSAAEVLIRFFLFILTMSIIFGFWKYSTRMLDKSIINYTIKNKQLIFSNIFNIFHNLHSNFFLRMPVISLFFIIYTIYLILNLKKADKSEILMLAWFILYYIQLSISFYGPYRFKLYLIPPMFFLAAVSVKKIFFTDEFNINLNAISSIIILFFIYTASYAGLWTFYRSILNRHVFYKQLYVYSSILTIILFTLLILFYKFKIFGKLRKKRVFIFISACFIFISLFQYSKWYKNSEQNLYEISLDISNYLTDYDVLAGWFAPELCINNNIHSLPSYNMSEKYLNSNNVTHLILQEYGNGYRKKFKNYNLAAVKKYYFSPLKRWLTLYAIKR